MPTQSVLGVLCLHMVAQASNHAAGAAVALHAHTCSRERAQGKLLVTGSRQPADGDSACCWRTCTGWTAEEGPVKHSTGPAAAVLQVLHRQQELPAALGRSLSSPLLGSSAADCQQVATRVRGQAGCRPALCALVRALGRCAASLALSGGTLGRLQACQPSAGPGLQGVGRLQIQLAGREINLRGQAELLQAAIAPHDSHHAASQAETDRDCSGPWLVQRQDFGGGQLLLLRQGRGDWRAARL